MIRKFIDFSEEIFPSIDTTIKNEIKNYLSQFNTATPNWFSTNLEILSQGDIISKIPFIHMNDSGVYVDYFAKGIILSNTCDLTRDDYITIAPLIPIKDNIKKNSINELKNNVISGKLCFDKSDLENYFVDFSRMQSFNRNVIIELINKENITKIHSLSQFGFYFLICKISIYYLRVENHENFNLRNEEIAVL